MKYIFVKRWSIFWGTAAFGLAACSGEKSASKSALIKDCPEQWISNAMPSIGSDKPPLPKEYYVYKGKRREISEFDKKWVAKNCKDLKRETVH